jgi:SAM-dependent methyltransferase
VPDEVIAPDGSPLDVYLALPAEPDVELIDGELAPRSSVLDLGSGPGRLANPLAARGHEVVAVDEAPEMLEHLAPGVVGMQSRIEELTLEQRFDAVVLASNLVNVDDAEVRRAFLGTCRRHVADDGIVLIQRYDPTRFRSVIRDRGVVGPVEVDISILEQHGPWFSARATYRIEERSWTQEFSARVLDDDATERALTAAGLGLERWLDDRRRWLRAVPVQVGGDDATRPHG